MHVRSYSSEVNTDRVERLRFTRTEEGSVQEPPHERRYHVVRQAEDDLQGMFDSYKAKAEVLAHLGGRRRGSYCVLLGLVR